MQIMHELSCGKLGEIPTQERYCETELFFQKDFYILSHWNKFREGGKCSDDVKSEYICIAECTVYFQYTKTLRAQEVQIIYIAFNGNILGYLSWA